MNKRGMSAVVTVLLLTLLAIVLVGVVWVVVKNLVVGQSELIEAKQKFFKENAEITGIKVNESNVEMTLKKTGGKIIENKSEEEIIISVEADVISVVDLSGSMRVCEGVFSSYCCTNTLKGSYISPNCYGVNSSKQTSCTSTCHGTWADRLTPLQNANKELIAVIFESEENRVGLSAYNNSAISSASLDLTDNNDSLNSKINSWQAKGNTCICCGINDAAGELDAHSSEDKMKTIIVMSDGDANVLCSQQGTGNAGNDAIKSACDANEILNNLAIYSVGVGGEVNEAVLEGIAACGNGEYFSVTDISNLTAIYQAVAEKITTSTSLSVHQFQYLLFVFSNSTDSYEERTSEIPDVLGTKKYVFDLSGKLEGEIIKIEIYPLAVSLSGKESIGPLLDFWEKD